MASKKSSFANNSILKTGNRNYYFFRMRVQNSSFWELNYIERTALFQMNQFRKSCSSHYHTLAGALRLDSKSVPSTEWIVQGLVVYILPRNMSSRDNRLRNKTPALCSRITILMFLFVWAHRFTASLFIRNTVKCWLRILKESGSEHLLKPLWRQHKILVSKWD